MILTVVAVVFIVIAVVVMFVVTFKSMSRDEHAMYTRYALSLAAVAIAIELLRAR